MVQAVQNNAHTLVSGNKCAYPQNPGNEREGSVASTSIAERCDDCGDEACEDETDTKAASKPDTGEIAITDGPTNKVGM